MSNKRTVYEDMELEEEKRRKRHEDYISRHSVVCPHCGKSVLDHLTKCPSCGGELTPKAYQPMSTKKIMIIRIVGTVVLLAVFLVLLCCFSK